MALFCIFCLTISINILFLPSRWKKKLVQHGSVFKEFMAYLGLCVISHRQVGRVGEFALMSLKTCLGT